jgi:signal peptidase I
MELNLPLIFLILIVVSGVVWLTDSLFFAKSRNGGADPWWVDYSKSFFPILFVVFFLRSFFYEPFQIPSGSMEPTLKSGDFILVNKFTYGLRVPLENSTFFEMDTPKRGDVMVFFPPGSSQYFIKRVVGLPGDRIQVLNGQVFINGEVQPQELVMGYPVNEPRVLETKETLGGVEHSMYRNVNPGPLSVNINVVVPEGHYFMMGDNRDNSNDSRAWGPVPEQNIVGRADVRWMFWDEFFSVPSFDRVGEIK